MASKTNKRFESAAKINRNFSEEFKKAKVKDLLNRQVRVRDLCRLYEVSRTTVYNWLYLYSDLEKGTKMVVQMESEQFKTQQLLDRIAELERSVGQKQLEIDYLSKIIEVESKEQGLDLKKKIAPKLSKHSGKTPPKTPTS
jgi:transposase